MLPLLRLSSLEKNSQFSDVELGEKLPDSKTRGIVIIYLIMELLFWGKKRRHFSFKTLKLPETQSE